MNQIIIQAMTDIGSIGAIGEAAMRYGYPFVLSVFLIFYVYKKQQKLDLQAQDREANYVKFLGALKDEIKVYSADSNKVVHEVAVDVDLIHNKMLGLINDVMTVKTTVDKIETGVNEIQKKITWIHKDA